MSKDWDFYLSEIDGKSVSIYLDLGIADDAPLERWPVLASIHLHLPKPHEDGRSSEAEIETLKAIEDALTMHLVSKSTTYVGRVTGDARIDFYFYIVHAKGWSEQVAIVLSAFPGYAFECRTRPDRDWTTYFEMLFPSDEDRERIQNRRICDSLKKSGDRLEVARLIEHWAYFATANARQKFTHKATELGYCVAETVDPEDPGDQFGIRLTSTGIPSHDNIDALTLPLFRAAGECNGDYEGWETVVVR